MEVKRDRDVSRKVECAIESIREHLLYLACLGESCYNVLNNQDESNRLCNRREI